MLTYLKYEKVILENNLAIFKMQAKILKTKMTKAEINLEIKRRDLVKVKEGFEEC